MEPGINRIALAIPARNSIFVKKGGSLGDGYGLGSIQEESVRRLAGGEAGWHGRSGGQADAIVFEVANYVSRIAYWFWAVWRTTLRPDPPYRPIYRWKPMLARYVHRHCREDALFTYRDRHGSKSHSRTVSLRTSAGSLSLVAAVGRFRDYARHGVLLVTGFRKGRGELQVEVISWEDYFPRVGV